MILGSHNSWSYLPPSKWYLYLFRFVAKCQNKDIKTQYTEYGVRCFDVRVRWKNDRLIVAHGLMTYKIDEEGLLNDLKWLNNRDDSVKIRILHEARNKKQYTEESVQKFKDFCSMLEETFPNLQFWCGRNLYDWKKDYVFKYNPSCLEKYSSVCKPKLIDDWYPKIFAKRNSKKIYEEGTTRDILLIDFVDYIKD